ncbi:hypothetical protein LTR05_007494 [Lithohypha guttulata]|uniref:Flavonol synthase n=1 Tax=Lithohypha guttulata TaxID=1690604 RepID=A0AAN7SV49_9EURO|nr:hypothetical protein LTR05_007494 [Lithohypha guttulata]
MAAVETLTTSTPLPKYVQTPVTQEELDWADLVTLDLSDFDKSGGKERLTKQLFSAVQNIGFFYVINFGLSQDEVDRQFAIGKELFNLPTKEKLKFRADLENGGYNGYKPLGLREIKPGYYDNTEIYNIPKFIPTFQQAHPDIVKAHYDEIEHFSKQIYERVVRKLLVLFALVLELPEDYFLQTHEYDQDSDCHLRYMKYHKKTAEENAQIDNVWVKGHTDFGSLTLLFRQPIASLQVRTPDGKGWKWVKPYPESITVNLADVLEFITNGFLKSSIHRVVAPPPDQANIDRHGVLYFVRPRSDLCLEPVRSRVLERLGYDKLVDEKAVGLTAGDWVKARVKKNVNKYPNEKGAEQETEILGGVKAKYYD